MLRRPGLKPLFSPSVRLSAGPVSSQARWKPLSGISAGGNRCSRAGNRSPLHILATIAAGGHSFFFCRGCKGGGRGGGRERGEIGGGGGNISLKLLPVWSLPNHKGGVIERGRGGGLKHWGGGPAVIRGACCVHASLWIHLAVWVWRVEREVGEKGVRGEGKVNRGGGFYVSCR